MINSRPAWRANVRAAYAAHTSNPEHRGPWGLPGTDRYSAFGFHRGGARSWTRFGKRGGMALTTTETYLETRTETFTYTDGTPPWTGTREATGSFSASVGIPRNQILIPATIDDSAPPSAYAYRLHASATAYGEGLYDAHGLIVFFAPTTGTDAVGYTGDWVGTDVSSTTAGNGQYIFRYESDATAINGLSTRTLVTAAQNYHGPAIAFRPNVVLVLDLPGGTNDEFNLTDIPFLPLETNPDGETYDGIGNPQTEVYFANTFLSNLVSGTFAGAMIRITGSASRTVPNYDDTQPVANTSWSHTWTRTGTLTLTLLSS